jgi:hypothetical protein
MRFQSNPLFLVVVTIVGFTIVSGTNKENKYGNYSTVYNDNEYIVLKRNQMGATKVFAPNPEHGKLIRDSVAETEIRMYREKFPGTTRYIDFNFNSLLGYISSFQNVENPDANKSLGVRIYPALDLYTKQMTVIISPTRNDRALWINRNLINARDGALDVEAFNTGSLCPLNCPDGDTALIAK